MAPELPFGGAERKGNLKQISIVFLYSLISIQKNGKNHEQKYYNHFRRNLETKPQHNQGNHRDHRHGIEGVEVNFCRPLYHCKSPHHHAQDNPRDYRSDGGIKQDQEALSHVTLQLSRNNQTNERAYDGRGVGKENRVCAPAVEFPDHEYDEE